MDQREEWLAELAGLAHAAGSITLRGGGVGLVLRTDRARIAHRMFLLLKQENAKPQLLSAQGAMGGHVYRLSLLSPHAERVLAACSMLGADGLPLLRGAVSAAQTRRKRQRQAYVRGVFLGCGALTDPLLDYHAEWSFAQPGFARDFAALLARMGLEAKKLERGEKHIVYVSGADRLSALLGAMGASATLFSLENTRVVKTVRNQVNRQVNAEAANLDKSAQAAAAQVSVLAALQASARWHGIPPLLRALGEARLANPDASLAELGELLSPPISKSGVSHRMKKLMALAQTEEA